MVEVSYERLATIFKALSDETRLHIIDMLSCNELCAADILASFNLSPIYVELPHENLN